MTLAQQQPAAPLLELIDAGIASLHVPGRVVLDGVNWTVNQNDCWVVAGLPASGKSDLLATAAGLMRPSAGRHRLFGRELADLDEDALLELKLHVGLVFGHGGRLFNHLTVAENLALPFCYHRNCRPTASEERVSMVLDAMDIGDVAFSTPGAINRGLRQRVALARALVLLPGLLFLDDPLAGIDPRETRWWLDFLDGLLQGHPILEGRKATLVVGTEDLQPWGERPCQYGLIQAKRFVPVGSRSELLKQRNQLLPELLPVGWLKE